MKDTAKEFLIGEAWSSGPSIETTIYMGLRRNNYIVVRIEFSPMMKRVSDWEGRRTI